MTVIDLFVTDRTGKRYAELGEANLEEASWPLCDIGSARFNIHPAAPGVKQIQLLKRELQIWFDGVLSWWGPILRVSGSPGLLTYECENLLSYFMRRIVDRASLDYTSIDQMSIMLDLIRYAQDELQQANRNLHILSANVAPSGKIRSRRYLRDEHAYILDLIKEFPTLSDGAEFSVEFFGDGRREFTPWYPHKGVTRANMVLEWGRNISKYTYVKDAIPLANHIYATGATNKDVKFEANYENTASSVEYGVMQGVIAEGSQRDVNWLLERATDETNIRSQPVFIPTVSCKNEPVQILGVVKDGDWVTLRIQNDDLNVNQLQRIANIQWEQDSINLTFSEVA